VVAYLFPGQGSQQPRMGERWLALPWAEELVARAEEEAGLPLRRYILEETSALSSTAIVQPALLLVEWVLYTALSRAGHAPEAAAGHSLGEFAALAACGALKWPEAIRLGALRGKLMEGAVRQRGGMLAVIKLPPREVERIAGESGCWVANYNSPLQTVISCPEETIETARKLVQAAGGKAIPLNVAGPFHSPAMGQAEAVFKGHLDEIELQPPGCPFISSVSGDLEQDPHRIKELLARQMSSPVRWTKALESLARQGITEAWEVGPGEVCHP